MTDSAGAYHAVRSGAGVAERGDHAQIRLWGKDPVRMVQGLITNDLANAPADRAVFAAMLTPKGRMIAELRALRIDGDGGTEVILDLPREALAGTREHLRRFVPPLFARWEEVSGSLGMLGIYGPRSHDVLRQALGDGVPALEEDGVWQGELAGAPLRALGTREFGEAGFDLLAPADALAPLREALLAAGAVPVGAEVLETLRIEAGRPRFGAELSEDIIPPEAWESTGQMERGISFTKGCYTGQEVIVRIAHRGHVNRHLRGLLLGAGSTAESGTPLHHPESGKAVGRITSVALSPRAGQPVALGYLRREIGPGDRVRVGAADGEPATVTALPFATARA